MSRRKKHKDRAKSEVVAPADAATLELPSDYLAACRFAEAGDLTEARARFQKLTTSVGKTKLKALIQNDLAVLAALEGKTPEARAGFAAALAVDPECASARANLALLDNSPSAENTDLVVTATNPGVAHSDDGSRPVERPATPRPVRVAVLSFLFNYPSTGGGNIHTAELIPFLARAGFDVKHFFVRYAPWEIGRVDTTPWSSEALDFDEGAWTLPKIQDRFRKAVDAFAPDYVLVTDAWNIKPHLAEAMRGYRTLLRFQALECVCPLNNVRLLPLGQNRTAQCPQNQLATPLGCFRCLRERGSESGGLHRAERELSGVGTRSYFETLCRALRDADAILVLNPQTEALLRPYARRVQVVTWGMDPARFPAPDATAPAPAKAKTTIFQAGMVQELMKGFHVLHAACERLWRGRQDFELVATGSPAGRVDEFTRFTGWADQQELPRYYREADIVVVPTVAQEGLSRTSVEAMAAGRPVVASRIGGLPFTVADGTTGLLCEPGDPDDLARKLGRLLDDAPLRKRLGETGRRHFEERFAWPVVIERDYRPLLAPVRTA